MKSLAQTIFCLAILTVAALPARAQTTPPTFPTEQIYTISAKAGGINFVEGTASVERANNPAQILASGDELRANDRVTVGAGGKLEVLLNPGSYLRLGENSKFEFSDTALESLKVKLTSGDAIIEAMSVGGKTGADVSIITPQTIVKLEKDGIYRINSSSTATEIFVWKGKIRIGDKTIKAGRKTVISNNGIMAKAVKFDREINTDVLAVWSKERAAELAKLNEQLNPDDLGRAVASLNDDSWNLNQNHWVYDRKAHRWCYVPWYQYRCCSPYGHGQTNTIAAVGTGGGGTTPTVVNEPLPDKSDSSSSSSDSSPDYSPSPSKSDSAPSKSDSSPPPAPPKSDPPPSKSDDAPSKKDGR